MWASGENYAPGECQASVPGNCQSCHLWAAVSTGMFIDAKTPIATSGFPGGFRRGDRCVRTVVSRCDVASQHIRHSCQERSSCLRCCTPCWMSRAVPVETPSEAGQPRQLHSLFVLVADCDRAPVAPCVSNRACSRGFLEFKPGFGGTLFVAFTVRSGRRLRPLPSLDAQCLATKSPKAIVATRAVWLICVHCRMVPRSTHQ